MARSCRGISSGGQRCNARPVRERDFCFWHDPEHATEASEARRLGGLRSKREATVEGAYDFDGVATIEDLQRILHVSIVDLFSLENSVQRTRAIIGAISVGAKLLEVGELSERIASLEAVLGARLEQNQLVGRKR